MKHKQKSWVMFDWKVYTQYVVIVYYNNMIKLNTEENKWTSSIQTQAIYSGSSFRSKLHRANSSKEQRGILLWSRGLLSSSFETNTSSFPYRQEDFQLDTLLVVDYFLSPMTLPFFGQIDSAEAMTWSTWVLSYLSLIKQKMLEMGIGKALPCCCLYMHSNSIAQDLTCVATLS